MKNKIAFLTIVSGFVLSVGCGFAFAGALGEAYSAVDNPDHAYTNAAANSGAPAVVTANPTNGTPSSDKAAPALKTAPAALPAAVEKSTEPAKPTLLEKMGKDLKDKKMDYAIAGGTGALTGYFLAGCVLSGALLGFGIIVVFLLLLRNV